MINLNEEYIAGYQYGEDKWFIHLTVECLPQYRHMFSLDYEGKSEDFMYGVMDAYIDKGLYERKK